MEYLLYFDIFFVFYHSFNSKRLSNSNLFIFVFCISYPLMIVFFSGNSTTPILFKRSVFENTSNVFKINKNFDVKREYSIFFINNFYLWKITSWAHHSYRWKSINFRNKHFWYLHNNIRSQESMFFGNESI